METARAMSELVLSPQSARDFRDPASSNGYRLVPVRTGSKQPAGKDWQHGADTERLRNVTKDELNTGILTAGLRCLDVDVDDPQIAAAIKTKILAHFPGAIIRGRANSSRFAAVVRAAAGQPGKRSVPGQHGQLEVLGIGQQFVAHGTHSSGASIEWENGRGPDTVPRDQLPAVTEDQVTTLLNECETLLGSTSSATGPRAASNIFEQPFAPPSTLFNSAAPVKNDLGDGIKALDWFDQLGPQEKSTLVGACLNAIDNRAADPREQWFRMLCAVADAGMRGCPDAEQLARDWSRRGASWTGDADFDTAWRSLKPGKIGVGSLIAAAKAASLDVSPWRDTAFARLQLGGPSASAIGAPPVALLIQQQQQQRAMHVSALALVPEKREWLHGTDAMRGAVTLFVAPGARGKSSWLVVFGLACASGRALLGAHVFGGPLKVLILSAEDPQAEVARRVRAAMQHHQLKDSDVPGLYIIGADKWGLPLLRSVGNVPAPDERGWGALLAEIDRVQPDIIVLDPLMSLMGGVDGNNNSAAAMFMGKLVELAATRRTAVIVAHHAAKGREPTSQDSALGAATFVNFARIVLTIEALAEKDAGRIGVPPWEVKSIFRVLGVKQNFSPADAGDRWFRHLSVTLNNARPPVYPSGDKIGVVEPFHPGASGPVYAPAVIRDALKIIHNASPPLSPSKQSRTRYAVPAIAVAIAPHRAGNTSDAEAAAVLDHLIRTGLVAVAQVTVSRGGSRSDPRNGLVVTTQGNAAMHEPASATTPSAAAPRSPQSHCGSDAGRGDSGGPKGPRNVPRGCGGNAGDCNAGASGADTAENAPQVAVEKDSDNAAGEPLTQTKNASADSAGANEPALRVDAAAPVEPVPQVPKVAAAPVQKADDDLTIPHFLRREDQSGQKQQAA
jgi:hypothetical protein